VGRDPFTDVAVIKIDAPGLTTLSFGTSADLRVGEWIVAIGNPGFSGGSGPLDYTVTVGIVSALGRPLDLLQRGLRQDGVSSRISAYAIEDFIQTDASINPGNSGGALVNMNGELVGINSAIISRTGGNVGIGFAVPSEIARSIMRQILDFGEVRRGLLGVTITTIDKEGALALGAEVESGALVSTIEPGSAAEKAGLQVDDIIVRVDDKDIDDSLELRNSIGLKGSGEEVDIEFVRDGKTSNVTAILGQQSASRSGGTEIHPGLQGAQFASSSTSSGGGVDVTDVEPGSPAAQRGLRADDTIIAVNRRSIGDLRELRAVAQGNRILFLLVQRGDRQLMLQIR